MREIDLNLLPVIIALIEEGSVSAAALRLHMSQPSLSTALGKLRRFFGDPLFVRTARGMEPTPRTVALLPPIRRALGIVTSEVLQAASFNPASSEKTLSIALSDLGEVVTLPSLVAYLSRAAPRMKVRSVNLPSAALERALELGDVDLALGCFPELKGHSFYQQRLYSHGFACVLRADHPIRDARLTTRQFERLGHLVVHAERGSEESFERFLAEHGIRRRIVLQTAHFMSVPPIVARSDLVATVPEAVGRAFASCSAIRMLRPPFDVPRFDVRQHWHRRVHQDPQNQWLRGVIHSLFVSAEQLMNRAAPEKSNRGVLRPHGSGTVQ